MFRFGIGGEFIVFLLAVVVLAVWLCYLLMEANKERKVIIISIIALFAIFGIGWFVPALWGLTGTWRLTSDFDASPRRVTPAPHMLQFFNDGTGTKINHHGYEVDFNWHITNFGELSLNTRSGSYIVRIYGFGTRLSIQNSLRGDGWRIGRFSLPRDFRAIYIRSFWN